MHMLMRALVKHELRVAHYELRVPLKKRVVSQNTSCELPHIASNHELKYWKCELHDALRVTVLWELDAAKNQGI